MKYPDFLDIRIALTGRVLLPNPHIDINRKAGLCVQVSDLEDIVREFAVGNRGRSEGRPLQLHAYPAI